jgi:hypothetical protein
MQCCFDFAQVKLLSGGGEVAVVFWCLLFVLWWWFYPLELLPVSTATFPCLLPKACVSPLVNTVRALS